MCPFTKRAIPYMGISDNSASVVQWIVLYWFPVKYRDGRCTGEWIIRHRLAQACACKDYAREIDLCCAQLWTLNTMTAEYRNRSSRPKQIFVSINKYWTFLRNQDTRIFYKNLYEIREKHTTWHVCDLTLLSRVFRFKTLTCPYKLISANNAGSTASEDLVLYPFLILCLCTSSIS